MATLEENIRRKRDKRVIDDHQQETGSQKSGLLTLTLRWENVLWLSLAISALMTRFWNLGGRVMSHDESLHVFYSWLLSKGSGYTHNPMMHGPFLFEATAFFNAIFGANDFTSRIVPALLGVGIVVAIPLLFRPWLGRTGALLCSLFFLVSPYILYYSRYNRHDIQIIAWVLLAAFAILAYLRDRKDSYLTLLAVALALMLGTFEISFIYLAIFASFLALRMLARHQTDWKAIRQSAEWDALMVLVTLGAFFSSPIALLLINPIWMRLSGELFVNLDILNTYGIEWASGEGGIRLWGLMAVFWAAAAGAGLWWGGRRWLWLAGIFLAITLTLFTTFFTNLNGIGTGFIGSLGYWLSQHGVERGSQPWYYYFIVFPLYEYFPLLAGSTGFIYFTLRRNFSEAARAYVLFAGWWAAWICIGLSIAGEKMPWLSTHITVPFVLLAAWFSGQVLDWIGRERPAGIPRRALAVGLPMVFLFLLTVRTSYQVNYVAYDYTTEFVGYAHGAPGVKWALAEVEKIAQRTGQGNGLKVAYDSEVTWPMAWYLRDYPGFFGPKPSRGALEGAAVVMAGADNWKKVEGYLGRDYARYEVIRMWWPMEDYKNLDWARVRGALTDASMRQAVWHIIWSRDYNLYGQLTGQALNPPEKWTPENRMRIYIRKDLAGGDIGSELFASQLPDLEPQKDVYIAKRIQHNPLKALAPSGVNQPRNIAAAPDGSFYLADTGNSRVVRLDGEGRTTGFLGSTAEDAAAGLPAGAPGTFNEPWGLAVDMDGNVYVADTWNHRIQKFDSAGNFITAWGAGGLRAEGADRFWGPRGVAVSADGKVYITDTGNRRVAVFDTQGQHLFDFDENGDAQLDEPVGIVVGPDNFVYVADTWNRRVAVFTLDGRFERSWPVYAWESASIDNKPYLAIDHQGLIYLTDPEGFRILVYNRMGEVQAEFGRFGEDEDDAFGLPTGITTGPDGAVWIVDATTNRVIAYPVLSKQQE